MPARCAIAPIASARLPSDGIGLVALSYRGYGGSTGSPSEAGLIADARGSLCLCRRAHRRRSASSCSANRSAPASRLRSPRRSRIGGLVLEAPFTSAVDIGAAAYWYLPVRLLMKDPFRSDARIGKVTAPLLVLHGARDGVVPIAHGERLFSLANEPKRFVRFAEGAPQRSRPAWRAGGGAAVPRSNPALKRLDTLAPPDFAPLSSRLLRRRQAARRGDVGRVRACRCAQILDFVGIRDRSFAGGSRPSRRRRRFSR